MKTIKEQILEDIKQAMKDKDSKKRDALRMLSSAFKQVEVDKRIVLNDEECIAILKTQLKQREDAKDSYESANRDDLLQQELFEIEIIKAYLPAQLSQEELEAKVKEIIKQVGASSLKDLGKVMQASSSISDVATGKRISLMAKKLLSD